MHPNFVANLGTIWLNNKKNKTTPTKNYKKAKKIANILFTDNKIAAVRIKTIALVFFLTDPSVIIDIAAINICGLLNKL